jgi:hypothetical protein
MTRETVEAHPWSVPMAYRLGWIVRRTAVHTLNRLAVHL